MMNIETGINETRFADTVELSLADLLTTEAQDAYEAEQLAAVREWLKVEGN